MKRIFRFSAAVLLFCLLVACTKPASPANDRPTVPEGTPEDIEYLYDFQFSEQYDARVSSDFALTFPAESSVELQNSTISLLARYQNEMGPKHEAVYDGDGMVPHLYRDCRYVLNEEGWELRVKTDFYKPDGLEFVSYVWTNIDGAKTSKGVGVGSSERELLSAYTDSLFYLDKEQAEPIYFSMGGDSDFEFDDAYVWQPFSSEANDVRDITFYLRDGVVFAVEMVKPFELRYVYGHDRDAELQLANTRRAELT